MLVSYHLLTTICKDISKYSIDQLVKAFNQVGIEVEQIKKHYQTDNLKLVKIINFDKCENSDHLHLVNVIDFDNNQYQIVCGANNLVKDKWAILAVENTKLWNDLVIKKRMIRGYESNGMLCGYNELTNLVPSNYKDEGIILFNQKEIKLNQNINQLLGLDDLIFDLSLPSNRVDLNSIEILIYELSMVLDIKFKIKHDFNLLNQLENNQQLINLDIDNQLCDFYGVIALKNQDFNLSWKYKQILLSSNINIYNNILDLISLYQLVYFNNLNVYQIDDSNKSINISLKVIDNQHDHNQLIGTYINNELINIIGINHMYKQVNQIKENQILLVELMHLNYQYLKHHYPLAKLESSWLLATRNYAKWISINSFNQILNYFNRKKQLISYQYFDFNQANNDVKKIINFKLDNFNSFVGVNFNLKMLKDVLKQMHFKFSFNKNEFMVEIEPFRLDLSNEYDIYEELLKYIDINQLLVQPIYMNVIDHHQKSKFNLESKFATYLNHFGLIETKTYNLVDKKQLDLFNYYQIKDYYKIINPISNQHEYFRTSIIYDLLKLTEYNLARKRDLYSVYEFNNLQINANEFHQHLSILFNASNYNNSLNKISYETNLLNIKWLIKNMLGLINQNQIEFIYKQTDNKNLVNGTYFVIKINDLELGYLAQIDNNFLKHEFKIEHNVYIVQLDFDLINTLDNDLIQLKPVSQFPYIFRSVNIEINDVNLLNEIIYKIKQIQLVIDCYIKDYYCKQNKDVYTLELKINDLNKTLNNEEINNVLNQVNALLTK